MCSRFPRTHTPGGLGRSDDSGCEHLSGLPRRSDGPLVLAAVLRGGRLRQAEGEGGALAGRQDGELAGVDGRRRRLGQRHLGAPLLAFVLHQDPSREASLCGSAREGGARGGEWPGTTRGGSSWLSVAEGDVTHWWENIDTGRFHRLPSLQLMRAAVKTPTFYFYTLVYCVFLSSNGVC